MRSNWSVSGTVLGSRIEDSRISDDRFGRHSPESRSGVLLGCWTYPIPPNAHGQQLRALPAI